MSKYKPKIHKIMKSPKKIKKQSKVEMNFKYCCFPQIHQKAQNNVKA